MKSSKLVVPVITNKFKNTALVINSYDIICIAALTQPNKAYLETDAQPATSQAILNPNEQQIAKKILYSTPSISSPLQNVRLLKLNQLNQKTAIAQP